MPDVRRPTRLDKQVITERRRLAAGLFLRRLPMEEIARQLKVSRATISGDLKALRQQWQQESSADMAQETARELAELAQIESDAALQFSATKGVEWLALRLKCKAQRAALLGLNAPQRQEHTGPSGGPLLFTEILVELPQRPESEGAVPPEPGANGNGLDVLLELPP